MSALKTTIGPSEIKGFSFYHLSDVEDASQGFHFDIQMGEKTYGLEVIKESAQTMIFLNTEEEHHCIGKSQTADANGLETRVFDQAASLLSLLKNFQFV